MNQAYYNWFTAHRRAWFNSWLVYTYSRQLASGGNQRGGKRKGRSK